MRLKDKMTKISHIHHWSEENFELRELRSGFRPTLEKPVQPMTDVMHEDLFVDAIQRLGIEGVEPVYNPDSRRVELKAPAGFTFQVTGEFTLWPDGNDLDWGYGPPEDSYEKWVSDNESSLEELLKEGYSQEQAEREVAYWQDDSLDDDPPDLQFFHGQTISLDYDGVTWGQVVKNNHQGRGSSDDKPATVNVTVDGYRAYWREQARRYIKIPKSDDDRMLAVHEYGEPGVIPCWQGYYVVGDIQGIKIELVPAKSDQTDEHLPVMSRLWVPQNIRYSLFDEYPELIDQDGDYNNRTNYGSAIRMLGGLATALQGYDGNKIDEIAGESDLAVIDKPMFANMDIDKLAELIEELIQEHNNSDPTRRVDQERENKKKEIVDKAVKKLVVVTELDQNIHQLVRTFGESDDWLHAHAEFNARISGY